jgi:hypothetical protein
MNRVAIAVVLVLLTAIACASPAAAPPAAPTAGSSMAIDVVTSVPPAFLATEQPVAEDSSGCNMDTLNGAPWVNDTVPSPDRAAIDIRGWGADVSAKVAPTATFVRLADQAAHTYFAPTTRQSRPGVAQKFGAASLEAAGYEARFSALDIPSGDYAVSIVMDFGGRALECSSKRTLHL